MILLLMLVIGAELASIAIYAVMYTQNAFEEVLPEWREYWDDRSISLFLMAIFGGWLFAPYFAWMLHKWIKEGKEKKDDTIDGDR